MSTVTSNGHAKAFEATRRTGLLRFATSGSVDDGKSTLIGRLLHDSKSIFEDQLEHVEQTSARRGDGYVNLALLTDGLRAEREQGITIDVAYRYFATPRRTFIIADTPGHEQYTRNMVTGASTADLQIVLVDARNGLVDQSRRHAAIAGLLGIPHVVVCVNKMDLVGWDEQRFDEVVTEFSAFAAQLGIRETTFVPISALHGDNVVERSEHAGWYAGPTLLEHLETVEVESSHDLERWRFPVQWVIRPMSDEHHDYRAYAGRVAGGILTPGEEVVVLPSGRRTRIAAIETADGELPRAFPPMSVAVRLEDDVDVSRGDLIARVADAPEPVRELEATVCWMDERPLRARGRYILKHTTRTVKAIVEAVDGRLDVATLDHDGARDELRLNDIGRVRLRTSAPLMLDPYAVNRETGGFILIDEATNSTVGAGMVAG
jgi:sulfate adenylyltransferase large subunit